MRNADVERELNSITISIRRGEQDLARRREALTGCYDDKANNIDALTPAWIRELIDKTLTEESDAILKQQKFVDRLHHRQTELKAQLDAGMKQGPVGPLEPDDHNTPFSIICPYCEGHVWLLVSKPS